MTYRLSEMLFGMCSVKQLGDVEDVGAWVQHEEEEHSGEVELWHNVEVVFNELKKEYGGLGRVKLENIWNKKKGPKSTLLDSKGTVLKRERKKGHEDETRVTRGNVTDLLNDKRIEAG